MKPEDILEQVEEQNDFTLHHDSVWINVGCFTIYIRRDGEGVNVEICPLHRVTEPVATMSAKWEEGA